MSFKNNVIRFVDSKIVINDIFTVFGISIEDMTEAIYFKQETIEVIDIVNSLDCLRHSDDLIFNITDTSGAEGVLRYLKRKGHDADLFKDWLISFAYPYVRDITNLQQEIISIKDLLKTIYK